MIDLEIKKLEKKVIHSFLNLEENTVPALAKKYKLPESRVHKILDKYLNSIKAKN
ncbi:hypothetical protein K5I29_02275 [Flavobacterium agricola]|uniref:Sigma-70-like protein n=1 Tax=Flavobacterium agricola TaxID=2870839 RepID=A0ABY6LZY6_9FLAO|nr:hypothetical protein [Flavobacterium agricola]UYW01771.1 hypothetical protein K5I29_02275 [Flavobacterium agricola]